MTRRILKETDSYRFVELAAGGQPRIFMERKEFDAMGISVCVVDRELRPSAANSVAENILVAALLDFLGST